MILENREYPRQKTKLAECMCFLLEKRCGQVIPICGMFFLLFLVILLMAELQLDMYRTTSQYLEDALAASNLASAVIDVREYGSTHKLKISDVETAFERFQIALKGNLGLNEDWECSNKSMIEGKVTVAQYVIYNVEGESVTIFHIDENGVWNSWEEMSGNVTAPNGVRIETTAVYSEIYYPVKGFLDVTQEARKGKLVDIAQN